VGFGFRWRWSGLGTTGAFNRGEDWAGDRKNSGKKARGGVWRWEKKFRSLDQ
jgi:hypothetical protein